MTTDGDPAQGSGDVLQPRASGISDAEQTRPSSASSLQSRPTTAVSKSSAAPVVGPTNTKPASPTKTAASAFSLPQPSDGDDDADPSDPAIRRSRGKDKKNDPGIRKSGEGASQRSGRVDTPETANQDFNVLSGLLEEIKQLRNEQERLRWVMKKAFKVDDDEDEDRNLVSISDSFVSLLDACNRDDVKEDVLTWFGLGSCTEPTDFRETAEILRDVFTSETPDEESISIAGLEITLERFRSLLESLEEAWALSVFKIDQGDHVQRTNMYKLWANEGIQTYGHTFDKRGFPVYNYNARTHDMGDQLRLDKDVHANFKSVVFGVVWEFCNRSRSHQGEQLFSLDAIATLFSVFGRCGPRHKHISTLAAKRSATYDLQHFIERYCGPWRTLDPISVWKIRHCSTLLMQFHMRSFRRRRQDTGISPREGKRDAQHTRCERQTGLLKFYGGHGHVTFDERRYSFTLNCSLDSNIPGTYVLARAMDDTFAGQPLHKELHGWSRYNIFPCLPLFGITAFQLFICHAIAQWAYDWSDLLRSIGETLEVQINDVLKKENRVKLMYDDADLQRSEYYFSLLQLLRIFGDWIRQSLHDLEGLEFGCKRLLEESVKDCKICVERGISSGRTQDKEQRLAARKIVMANWRTVRAYQRERAQPLLDNINLKTEEIRSLRDGLFNAQSVREATKSSEVNRYLFIFTVATILYLPPSFVSTFYGMDLYVSEENMPRTRTVFWTVFGLVSGLTYVLAFLGILGVRRKDRLKAWLKGLWLGSRKSAEETSTESESDDWFSAEDVDPVPRRTLWSKLNPMRCWKG